MCFWKRPWYSEISENIASYELLKGIQKTNKQTTNKQTNKQTTNNQQMNRQRNKPKYGQTKQPTN